MSQYIVSARKYRPQRFEDVVGQQHVTETLKNALGKDQLAHAFLFCGPRGVGKTTCARILAKALNCENPTEDNEPCNECTTCKAMNESASFNIVELDAASNNSVDHIRSLNDQIRIPPQAGDYRVFIIDEVHMLSLSAFNAFLKTLEEPPSYAVFILATTEKHKILPTILSRCQIYDFRRIQVKDIRDQLEFIAEQEGVDAQQDALHLIAMKADGALRDALSIFDRIVSACGQSISYNDVVDQLNILDYDYFFKMADALIAEDVPGVYAIFDEIIRRGFQPDHFIIGLGSHLRDLLVCQYEKTQSILEFSDSLRERYVTQALAISKDFLIRSLYIINHCDTHYQRAQNKRLHVEMALNHICFSSRYEDKMVTTGEKSSPRKDIKSQAQMSAGSSRPISTSPEKKVSKTTSPQDSSQEKGSPSSDKKQAESEKKEIKDISEEESEGTSSQVKKQASARSGNPEIPTLDSLDNLKSTADEERKRRNENKIDFNQENLDAFITEWTENLDSTSAISAMKFSEFHIDVNHKVKVLIGSKTDETVIKNSNSLLNGLRTHFMIQEIQLNFETSKNLMEKRQAEKPLSSKEKLEKISKENPRVQELQRKLDLEIDD